MGHRAVVLGASGYGGLELLRLAEMHPGIEVVAAAANRSAGEPVASFDARFELSTDAVFVGTEEALETSADIVFSSLPAGKSAELLSGHDGPVVDLSGDFRLTDPSAYEDWYGFTHPHPEELGSWVYGLTEWTRDEISPASKIAGPGCYAALALLGLGPLAEANLLQGPIYMDARSGVSGAGRASSSGSPDVEGVRPYRPIRHQHIVEIEQQLAVLGASVNVSFVPHLVPMFRGISMTCFVHTPPSKREVSECLRDRYVAEPFVEVLGEGDLPDTASVIGTNSAQLATVWDERTATWLILGALDNLGKGAAGQAIQNANLILGYPETLGLGNGGPQKSEQAP